MGPNNEHSRTMRRLQEDKAALFKAATALKLEELKAKQEKALLRKYRQRQLRIWLTKAKTTRTSISTALKELLSRKRLLAGAAALAVVMVAWGALSVQSKHHAKSLGARAAQQDFKFATPQDASQKVTTTENNHQKIASYEDAFAGANLVVSQQKLPDSFRSDPQAITKLDQFKSAQSLDTPKGKLYVATNATGQQWAALTYGDLLIFFQTTKTIDPSNWSKYISTLKIR